MLNFKTIQKQAARLHANAKDGQVKIDDEVYQLVFNRAEGVFDVIEPSGDLLLRYNTRSINQAKQWLKEFLSN